MPVQVEGKSLGRPMRYPWDLVMDGQYWELKRGIDFEDLEKCRAAAGMYASRHKLEISTTKVDDDTLGIEVLSGLE